ncbi:4'-phosphopantetheinyl transferase superfamily protein [Oerskovia sp. Sa2CUA8]|uniref:4'-phosphopantetheinyl transferase superfamily protein n=2 Tax=Oerskovia TaxID=162491 RepID=A0ABR8V014_9CELL|nr:4'-phosphopantetheinyl transferase superfamily protein [Oerskovia gallyi]
MTGLVTMRRLLPPTVAVHESSCDLDVPLFDDEQSAIADAVEERRREFVSGRACARRAMAELDESVVPVPCGPQGEPVWSHGLVGSITHCRGYRAAAVARVADVIALGIDAEPHERLPDGVLDLVALPDEAAQIQVLRRDVPAIHWDRLLFCAKEAVYKGWFPVGRIPLGFAGASVVLRTDGTFSAQVLAPQASLGALAGGLAGRWSVGDGYVAAAVAMPSPTAI